MSISRETATILRAVVDSHSQRLLFATISGAHLYGFPSADSDYDLRGVHLLPLHDVIGLKRGDETIESSRIVEGLEIDLVTHDVAKFFGLLLQRNGYVLEQLYSPLIIHTTPEHAELKQLALGCITRHHAHHYVGFARTQWALFEREPRVKYLLYVYRVLLTGIHLMRSGEVEANLQQLNDSFRLPYIGELIARKKASTETGLLTDADRTFHQQAYERLTAALEAARDASILPEQPTRRDALHEMLVRLRLSHM